MKPQFVSAMAMLFCCAIFAVVGVFAYSRYEAQKSENAAFSAQLRDGAQNQQPVLGTHMPGQLPPRGGTTEQQEASPSPSPAQQ